MSDPESPSVTLTDSKPRFRWPLFLGRLWVIAWFLSLFQLRAPNLSMETRLFWCLAPLPLMALGFWQIVREARSKKEMELRVSGEAVGYAFPLTVAFYASMGLAHLGFPIEPETWATSWIFPMLIYVACWLVVYRRYNPQ